MMPVQIQHENAATASPPSHTMLLQNGERLRVLHVVSCLGMGGTEHGVLKVINGLGEDQFEHRICAVRGIDADFARRMNAPHAYSVGSAKPGFQFPLFRLVRIMKEFRPHIVHTRNFGALEAIPAARMARVPVAIHSEHGYELEILAGLPLRRRVLCRAFYAMADAVFAVTGDLRTYHSKQSWLPATNFRVIYNGVNLERFSRRVDAAPEVRRKYGIPEGRVVVGSVGRLVPIKDHATLLRAAEALLRQGKDMQVLLVGDGPESAKLKESAAASPALAGRVTFTGASDCVPELLSAMDVFVLPSICEGMSNTLLEAMASGLPVVATRTGGNPELVEDGQSGCLFSPRDAEGLAHVLGQLTEDASNRRKFGKAARDRAVEQFSLTGMMQRYRDLYLELASRRGSGKRN
ncbi:MAG: glycosyltransferase [Acidobacteriia bacterium]|nr:glycosyltransferase [Terriglobia bacterium]